MPRRWRIRVTAGSGAFTRTHVHTPAGALGAHHGLHKSTGSQFRKAGWGSALDLWTRCATGEMSMKATRHSGATRGVGTLRARATREGETMTKLIIFNATVKCLRALHYPVNHRHRSPLCPFTEARGDGNIGRRPA